ncbi:MAG: rane protein of unknown function [Blastococcus sp.]|nr:rane protein of unknown function [Blastococcus sp.]
MSPAERIPFTRLGHTGSRALTASMVLAAVAFVAVTLGTSLIGRTAFYGGGIMLNQPPWNSEHYEPVATDNNLVGDTIDVVIPSRHQMVERVHSGDLPGWSSMQAAGQQLGSVPNLGLLAPTAIAWWVLPEYLAPGWERLTILVVAATGTALFLRRVGLGRHAAWLGGMVYAGTGFMVAWTNWPQAAVGGMLPWLFWSVERSLQQRTLRSVVPIALTVASLVFGGFPAVVGLSVYAAAGYAVVRLMLERRARRENTDWKGAGAQVLRLALGLMLGVGLAAVQLAVFAVMLGALDTSYRAGGFNALMPLRMSLTTLFPNTWGINSNTFFPYTNQIESNAYLGASAAVLAVLALVVRVAPGIVRGARAYFGATTLVCGLLLYVQPPFLNWIGSLPVFSGNPVGRLVSIFLLALSFLAGFGADSLLRPLESRPSLRRRLLTAVPVTAFGLVVVALALFVRSEVNRQRPTDAVLAALPISPWLVVAVASAGVVVLLVVLAQWRPRLAAAAFIVVPVLVAVQGIIAAAPLWGQIRADRFYPVTTMHRYLLGHLGHDRLATTGLTMLNGTPAQYGLRTVTGHVFFQAPYSDLINRIAPTGRYTATYWDLPDGVDLRTWQSPGLDRLATKYIVSSSDNPIPGAEIPVTSGTAPAPLSGKPVDVALPAGPLRGVYLKLESGPARRTAGYVVASVRDAGGRTVASTRRLVQFPRVASPLPIPLAGEDAGSGKLTLSLSWSGPAAAPILDSSPDGRPTVTVIKPQDDGLRLVSDDDGSVWQRTTSLSRIRWASQDVVITDPTARANAVASQPLPPAEVVLSHKGEAVDDKPATLDVREDSGDTVSVDVRAQGAGYLVLADAVQQDWSVSVDGRPASIEPADHAFGAVHVGQGTHRVQFTYTPRGQKVGALVSLLSLLVLVGLAIPPGLWARARPDSTRR